jgi:hypothetical protein
MFASQYSHQQSLNVKHQSETQRYATLPFSCCFFFFFPFPHGSTPRNYAESFIHRDYTPAGAHLPNAFSGSSSDGGSSHQRAVPPRPTQLTRSQPAVPVHSGVLPSLCFRSPFSAISEVFILHQQMVFSVMSNP